LTVWIPPFADYLDRNDADYMQKGTDNSIVYGGTVLLMPSNVFISIIFVGTFRFSLVTQNDRDIPNLPPWLTKISLKMSKPPASVNKAILIEIVSNVMTGLVMLGLLYYFAKKFDPDKVDKKTKKRSNIYTILKNRRAKAEEQ
jgi:uncharacterized membrane protein